MSTFLFSIGFFGVLVTLVVLAVFLFMKRPKKGPLILLGVFFVMFAAGLSFGSNTKTVELATHEAVVAEAEKLKGENETLKAELEKVESELLALKAESADFMKLSENEKQVALAKSEADRVAVEQELAAQAAAAQAEADKAAAVQLEASKVTLTSGIYVAGQDFPAGIYDIVAIKGDGNVSSDNIFDGGINAIMGVSNNGFSEKEYKNIRLLEGTELSVSRVTIQLVPKK